MINPIPRVLSALHTLCDKVAAALHIHETTIGIMHNTESVLRTELAGSRSANSNLQTAKAARLAAFTAQDVADTNGTAFIASARDVLKTRLGGTYSQAWDEPGFPNQSIAVPRRLAERTELLKNLETYFTNHPTHEVASLNEIGRAHV